MLCALAAMQFDAGQAYSNSKVLFQFVALFCDYSKCCYAKEYFHKRCNYKSIREATSSEELISRTRMSFTRKTWMKGRNWMKFAKNSFSICSYRRSGDRFGLITFTNPMKEAADFFERQTRMRELLSSKEKPFGWMVILQIFTKLTNMFQFLKVGEVGDFIHSESYKEAKNR